MSHTINLTHDHVHHYALYKKHNKTFFKNVTYGLYDLKIKSLQKHIFFKMYCYLGPIEKDDHEFIR